MFSRIRRAVKTVFRPSPFPRRDPALWATRYYIDAASAIADNRALICRHPTTTALHGLVLLDRDECLEAKAAATWLCQAADGAGRLWLDAEVPRYFCVCPGKWYSGMTQGLSVSLLARLWLRTSEPWAADAARRLANPLFRAMSDGGCLSTLDGLGPFIEEICIPPGMHVLNGAVFGYWGMRDLVLSGLAEPGQRDCADEVLRCVAAALPRFSLRWNWSKYDVATRTVASREYHRLHAAQAHVLARQSASPEASHIAAAWEGADTFVIALWYSLGKGGRESLRRLFHLRRHALQQQAVR